MNSCLYITVVFLMHVACSKGRICLHHVTIIGTACNYTILTLLKLCRAYILTVHFDCTYFGPASILHITTIAISAD